MSQVCITYLLVYCKCEAEQLVCLIVAVLVLHVPGSSSLVMALFTLDVKILYNKSNYHSWKNAQNKIKISYTAYILHFLGIFHFKW